MRKAPTTSKGDQAGPTANRVRRTGEADDTTPRISRTLNAGLRPTMLKRDVRTQPPSASEIPVHPINAGSYDELAHEI